MTATSRGGSPAPLGRARRGSSRVTATSRSASTPRARRASTSRPAVRSRCRRRRTSSGGAAAPSSPTARAASRSASRPVPATSPCYRPFPESARPLRGGVHMVTPGPQSSARPSRRLPLARVLLAPLALGAAGPAFADDAPERITLRGAQVVGVSAATVFEGDLRDLPLEPQWKPGDPIKEIPRRTHHAPRIVPEPAEPQVDPLLEVQARAPQRGTDPPLLNFPGQGFTGVNPPDAVGDAGLAHYIQSINSGGGAVFTVYNKANGSVAAGPIAMDSLGTGHCANRLRDPGAAYRPPAAPRC